MILETKGNAEFDRFYIFQFWMASCENSVFLSSSRLYDECKDELHATKQNHPEAGHQAWISCKNNSQIWRMSVG